MSRPFLLSDLILRVETMQKVLKKVTQSVMPAADEIPLQIFNTMSENLAPLFPHVSPT